MSRESRRAIDRLQVHYTAALCSILRDGKDREGFRVPDLTVTAFLLFSLGEHIVNWYDPTGRITPAGITDMMFHFARRMIGRDEMPDEVADWAAKHRNQSPKA
ncbi:MAG TPA: hypothetical protein VMX74_08025 [Pirellulales bacterium]|nr:hypothetical protein [Pirellulales bacterium]